MIGKIKPPIRCNTCGKRIDESDPLAFGGGLACERCVRTYYLEIDLDEACIQTELRYRRSEAGAVARRLKNLSRNSKES